MAYAFFSHETALSVLRHIGSLNNLWPARTRTLPKAELCVRSQRGYASFAKEHDLSMLGIDLSQPVHLLVSESNARTRGKQAQFHLWSEPLPARSLIRFGKDILVTGPELTLLQLSQTRLRRQHYDEMSREMAGELARFRYEDGAQEDFYVWEKILQQARTARLACELAGSYRLVGGSRGVDYRARPLMSVASANVLLDKLPGARGTAITCAALSMAFDNSASPMETALVIMLTFPTEFGGFGLPRPILNKDRGVRGATVPDMLWESEGLVLEYDSYEFHEGLGAQKVAEDAERANELTAQGYYVLRATKGNVQSLAGITTLAAQIARILDEPLVEPDALQLARRQRLLAELVAPMPVLP